MSADLILRFCSLTFSKGKAKDPQASKGRFSVLRLAYTGDRWENLVVISDHRWKFAVIPWFQWNPVNAITAAPFNPGRNNEVAWSHNHCLGFLLGQLYYPGEIGNNGYAIFWGGGGGGLRGGKCSMVFMKVVSTRFLTGFFPGLSAWWVKIDLE